MSIEKTLVYLVEDPLLGQLMSAYLQTVFKGLLQVEKFSSFETAWSRFESARPQPAIVYGAMLQGKGVPLCVRVKAAAPSVRFILASGSLPETINEALLNEGCWPDAVLHKPFSLEQVQAVVQELMPGKPLTPLGVCKSGVWPFFEMRGSWRAFGLRPQPPVSTPDTFPRLSE